MTAEEWLSKCGKSVVDFFYNGEPYLEYRNKTAVQLSGVAIRVSVSAPGYVVFARSDNREFDMPAVLPSLWTYKIREPEVTAKPEHWPHTCRCGAPGLMLFSSFDCSKKCSYGR